VKLKMNTRFGAGLCALAMVTGLATVKAEGPLTLVDIVKGAIAAYRDPGAATAAGWGPATGCVAGPQGGAMGFHHINPLLLGDDLLDPRQPEALIYERRGERTTLVGAEFIVLASAWHATHAGPPVLEGQHFQFVGSPNRYGLAPFYELHVWAGRPNPTGAYADWHPHVSCDMSSDQ
jgi:hypothetical protein